MISFVFYFPCDAFAHLFGRAFWERFFCTAIANFSTFEAQRILIESTTPPLLCALVDRSPKTDKDFIKDFSDFISYIIAPYDRLLILGDINIHVCYSGKPMVTEFTYILFYVYC